jgi:hypothetical protein
MNEQTYVVFVEEVTTHRIEVDAESADKAKEKAEQEIGTFFDPCTAINVEVSAESAELSSKFWGMA